MPGLTLYLAIVVCEPFQLSGKSPCFPPLRLFCLLRLACRSSQWVCPIFCDSSTRTERLCLLFSLPSSSRNSSSIYRRRRKNALCLSNGKDLQRPSAHFYCSFHGMHRSLMSFLQPSLDGRRPEGSAYTCRWTQPNHSL